MRKLLALLGFDSVDAVLGDFESAVARLEAITTRASDKIAKNIVKITTINNKIKKLDHESDRARRAANKLKDLIS